MGLNTSFGERKVAAFTPMILVQFQYNISTEDVTTTLDNGGTVTQDDSMAVVSSSTAVDGTAIVMSKDVLRYRPGYEAEAKFTAMFPNGGVAGVTQYVGLFDSNDGYFVGFDGTDFVVAIRKDGSDTKVTQSNFNINNLSELPLRDFTKLNVFRISFGWLGTSPIIFEIQAKDGSWIPFHKFEIAGENTGPSVTNPVLPICCDVTKTSGGTDIIVKSASWSGGVNGDPLDVGERHFLDSDAATLVGAAEQHLFTIRNKTTFQSKTNRVVVIPKILFVEADGTKRVDFFGYLNATITAPTYADHDAANSVIEVDKLATIAGGTLRIKIPLAKIDSDRILLKPFGIKLRPGDTFTITSLSASASDVEAVLDWDEQQ